MGPNISCIKHKNCTHDKGRFHYVIGWEADEDGNVPVTMTPHIDGYMVHVVTKPGTPAPKSGYGITLKDACGVDTMNGSMASLSNSSDEQFVPSIAGKKGNRMVQGQLTFELSGNTNAGAKGKCIIFIQE